MLKRIANLLEDKSLIIAIALTILIAYLSFTSKQIPEIEIGNIDKYAHIIFYTILSFSWFLALSIKNTSKYKSLLIGFCVLFYGIIIEVIQENYTTNREGDIYDVIANAIGILIGFGIFIFWKQKIKVLK